MCSVLLFFFSKTTNVNQQQWFESTDGFSLQLQIDFGSSYLSLCSNSRRVCCFDLVLVSLQMKNIQQWLRLTGFFDMIAESAMATTMSYHTLHAPVGGYTATSSTHTLYYNRCERKFTKGAKIPKKNCTENQICWKVSKYPPPERLYQDHSLYLIYN